MERTDVKNNHTEEYSTGQIRCIEKSDPEYPQIMKQYSSMPAKLYVKGRLPDPKRRTVAVIGARMCSPYGRMQAFRYAKALSVAGVQIISGMALGIDSEGHKGALEGKMPKFAAKFKNKAFDENGLEVEVKVNGKKQSLKYKL